jgi:N-methylhydantoinase B
MTNLCDPVTLEILRGAVRAAQAEMEALLERTAISAFIREKKDFYTALFDADGVMAVGSNVPIFGDITGPVFRDFPADTMQPGDLYWYNDCYGSRGAVSHSNDQVLLAPVFHDGKRCAFVMGWAHFADIGGLRAGSISPETTDIFQEGIIVPPTKQLPVPRAKPRRHARVDGVRATRRPACGRNSFPVRRRRRGRRIAAVAGTDPPPRTRRTGEDV